MTLDGFEKKLSDAADFAVKKAEGLSAAAKLNIKLSAERGNLSRIFENIGEIYYKQRGEDGSVPETIEQLITEADLTNEKIAELKKQIAALKKRKHCIGCGAVIEKDAVYCSKCGAKQEAESSN